MSLWPTLRALFADVEQLPANQDFDLLVQTALTQIAAGKSLPMVVSSLIQNQKVQEHLAMVIAAAAYTLSKVKS